MSNDKNKTGDSEFFDDSEGVCSYIIVENTGLFYNDFYEQVFTNSKWSDNIKKIKYFMYADSSPWNSEEMDYKYQKCVNVE